MSTVLIGEGQWGKAVSPTQEHKVASIHMLTESYQILTNGAKERMLGAKQFGTVARQLVFSIFGAGAQYARSLDGKHNWNLVRARQLEGRGIPFLFV
ncbi:MAG TPA: hypothetical protein VLA26_03720 [Gammaproteobacteria bacterium]|nr:hypothetical protein [Gammaproteobacteria bacterium]